MNVLGICSYPVEAAATRFRMDQFVGPLSERSIDLTISPFLSSGQFRELYEDRGDSEEGGWDGAAGDTSRW